MREQAMSKVHCTRLFLKSRENQMTFRAQTKSNSARRINKIARTGKHTPQNAGFPCPADSPGHDGMMEWNAMMRKLVS